MASTFAAAMALIRALPPLEAFVEQAFVQYQAWRVNYDKNQALLALQAAAQKKSTVALNDFIGKRL